MTDAPLDDSHLPEANKKESTGKKKTDAITAVVLLAFSAYIIIGSLNMKLSSEYGPGPGFFPLGLGMILAILSLGLLWDGINPRKKDKPSPFKDPKRTLTAGLAILALVGYALLITKLGYLLTTFLLVLFLMGVVARDKVRTTLLTALGVTLLLYLIFQVGLDLNLPTGPFGF